MNPQPSQYSQKKPPEVLYIKKGARASCFNGVAGLRSATLLKKKIWRRSFPVNFAKFLRTLFFTEHLRWLLL